MRRTIEKLTEAIRKSREKALEEQAEVEKDRLAREGDGSSKKGRPRGRDPYRTWTAQDMGAFVVEGGLVGIVAVEEDEGVVLEKDPLWRRPYELLGIDREGKRRPLYTQRRKKSYRVRSPQEAVDIGKAAGLSEEQVEIEALASRHQLDMFS